MYMVAIWSLKSPHKEAPKIPLLCEDWSDHTSPTSNQMPDIHITFSVVYDTLKKSFSRMHVHVV